MDQEHSLQSPWDSNTQKRKESKHPKESRVPFKENIHKLRKTFDTSFCMHNRAAAGVTFN